ncbi:MAG: 50S ribosomal protein L17 [Syntrophomonas sp.]|nr:50S ribosomal protein L17 [Syntrophomonas sp.]
MSYRRLGFRADHRRALLRNSVTSLLEHEKITTTETRAKEISSIAEKMITLGKRGDLHSRRLAGSYLMSEDVVTKLFTGISERYKERQGGYTRIIKTGVRKGDGAPMAIIELLQ